MSASKVFIQCDDDHSSSIISVYINCDAPKCLVHNNTVFTPYTCRMFCGVQAPEAMAADLYSLSDSINSSRDRGDV